LLTAIKNKKINGTKKFKKFGKNKDGTIDSALCSKSWHYSKKVIWGFGFSPVDLALRCLIPIAHLRKILSFCKI
jgi:hypothetical protein